MIDPTKKEIYVEGGRGPGEISQLTVRFVLPQAGAFGRDKNVPMAEAGAATVTYRKDGQLIDGETVSVETATGLVDQATRDAAAAQGRLALAGQQQRDEQAEVQAKLAALACQVCGGRTFDEQTSREDSQWGYTTFRMKMLICNRCGFVMHFALGRSMFVPG